MLQSKAQTHIEVICNQIIGIAVGWLIVRYAFPPLERTLSPSGLATVSTFIFFVASYIRLFTIRRIFNKGFKKGSEDE